MLEATAIEKSLGEESILRDVDVAVGRGEVTVLMGPNGAGKTVLLCCLSGGLHSTAGTTTVGGRVLPSGRRNLSLLLQDSMAIDRLTGRENAEFYADLHPRSGGRWPEYVRKLGLAADIDRPVREYSGGMRRKLEIAIAFDADVPLYLLDEPTAGLDLRTIRSFHDLILDAVDRGKSFLLASHVPLDMEIADTVSFVDDGAVTAEGSPRALLRSLPDVVRVRGDVGRLPSDVYDYLVGKRLFERGDEARGFLDEERGLDELRRVADDGPWEIRVDPDPPSYADLFNYLAIPLENGESEGSS